MGAVKRGSAPAPQFVTSFSVPPGAPLFQHMSRCIALSVYLSVSPTALRAAQGGNALTHQLSSPGPSTGPGTEQLLPNMS